MNRFREIGSIRPREPTSGGCNQILASLAAYLRVGILGEVTEDYQRVAQGEFHLHGSSLYLFFSCSFRADVGSHARSYGYNLLIVIHHLIVSIAKASDSAQLHIP